MSCLVDQQYRIEVTHTNNRYRFFYGNREYAFKIQDKVHQFFFRKYLKNECDTVNLHINSESYYLHFSLGEPEKIRTVTELRYLLSLEGDGVWIEQEGAERRCFVTTSSWPVFRYKKVDEKELVKITSSSLRQKALAVALAFFSMAPGLVEVARRIPSVYTQAPALALALQHRNPVAQTLGFLLFQTSLATASEASCLKESCEPKTTDADKEFVSNFIEIPSNNIDTESAGVQFLHLIKVSHNEENWYTKARAFIRHSDFSHLSEDEKSSYLIAVGLKEHSLGASKLSMDTVNEAMKTMRFDESLFTKDNPDIYKRAFLYKCFAIYLMGIQNQEAAQFYSMASTVYSKKVLEIISSNIGDPQFTLGLLGITVNSLAQSYMLMKEYENAAIYLVSSLEMFGTEIKTPEFLTAIERTVLGGVSDVLAQRSSDVRINMYLEREALSICYRLIQSLNADSRNDLEVVKIAIILLSEQIGSIYMDQSNYQEALSYLEKVLKAKRAHFGDEHAATASTYRLLAKSYMKSGNDEKGFDHYYKALQILKINLGLEHPKVTDLQFEIAIVHKNRKQFLPAAALLDDTIQVFNSIKGRKPEENEMNAALEGLVFGITQQGEIMHALFEHEKAVIMDITAILMIFELHKVMHNDERTRQVVLEEVNRFDKQFSSTSEPLLSSSDQLAVGICPLAIKLNDERIPKLLFSLGKDFQGLRKNELSTHLFKAALTSAEKVYGKDHSLTHTYRRELKRVEERICTVM